MTKLDQKIIDNVTIVAGMPRAGTTWLYSVLCSHPAVKLPVRKETNYFSTNFDKGTGWYRSLYEGCDLGVNKSFDISPIYFFDQNFIDNYRQSGSNQKVILILREVHSWVESAYWQVKSYDPFLKEFSSFIEDHDFKLEDRSVNVKLKQFDFLKRVELFNQAFPGKLLLIDFAMIRQRPVEVLNLIEDFSGLPTHYNEQNTATKPVNVSGTKTGFLTTLSNVKWFNHLVLKLFPRSLIVKVRDKWVYNSVAADAKASPKKVTDNPFPKELFKNNVFKQTWFHHS